MLSHTFYTKQCVHAHTGDAPELCVKPAMGTWGLHKPLPRITCSQDLMLYGLALQHRWHSLPEDYLTTDHPAIDLPPLYNQQLMVEPYIHVARSALASASTAALQLLKKRKRRQDGLSGDVMRVSRPGYSLKYFICTSAAAAAAVVVSSLIRCS